ncbi:MAG: hypothetical protein ABIK96_04760 [bacterium]
MTESRPHGAVLALVDHPNLDILLGPVLKLLLDRGHRARAMVVQAGRPDRLAALGVPLVEDLEGLDRFLEGDGPRVMINGADMIPQHTLGIQADLACRARDIPTLTLEHAPFAVAYDDGFPPHVDFAADVMAVIGEVDRQEYLALGIDPSRLVVTGSPPFDQLVQTREARSGVESAPRDIAVFSQSHTWAGPRSSQGHDLEAWRDQWRLLYEVLGERFPEARILVKPHPAEPFHGTDRIYLDAVPAGMAGRIEVLPTEADNAGLILGSRFVLSFSSTVWLEARILGRPCAFFPLQKRGGRLARDVEALGGIWIPGKSLDFVERLRPHLDRLGDLETGLPEGDLLERYAGPLDGGATARIAAAVERLLEEGPPPAAPPALVFDGEGVLARRLRPQTSYANYVHLEALARAAQVPERPQPFVLGVVGRHRSLRDHLPLAQYSEVQGFPETGGLLPFADLAFDCVIAPDLLLAGEASAHPRMLAELLRLARVKVVTSLPTGLGRERLLDLAGLVELDLGRRLEFGTDQDLAALDRFVRDVPGVKVTVKDCHHAMSWLQSEILENLGLEPDALEAVRLSLQAVGPRHEARGHCVRRIYILTPER